MKRFTTVLVALGGMMMALVASAAPMGDSLALIVAEKDWSAAEVKHDAAALQRLLDDQFVCTFGTGKPLNKEAYITQATAGAVDPTSRQDLNERYSLISGDTAITVVTKTLRHIVGNQPIEQYFRVTTTFVRRDNDWRVLATHAVQLPPKGR